MELMDDRSACFILIIKVSSFSNIESFLVGWLGFLDLLESINTLGDLTVSNSLGKDFFHLVFLFFLSLFRVSSDLPFFNILMPGSKLKGVDFWTDFCQLLENWHDDKLDETSLTSSNVGGCSIAHHGNIEPLSFFHITLVKELVE